jgi:hypothetical protein
MGKIKFKEYHKNPRRISDKQERDLREWMELLGDISGIIYNKRSGEFIGGNQRSKQMDFDEREIEWVEKKRKADKQGTVGVGYVMWEGSRWNFRMVDWDEELEEKANVIANKAGGEWDWDILNEEFDVDDLLDWGFNEDEVKKFEKEVEEKEEPGEIRFSRELGRTADYIVLKFDNKIDFLQAKTLLNLASTYSKRQNGKPWSRGIGRVVNGSEAINRLRGDIVDNIDQV